VRSSGVLYLVPDSGEGLLSGNLTNSQCSVDRVPTSAVVSGNLITLTLRLTFGASFAGNKVVYQAAANRSGTNSNWTALGVWNVPSSALTAPSAPIVSSFSPARTTGSRQTVSMTITRADGIADLNVVNPLINNALDGRDACYLAYVWPTKTLYLVPDSGTGLLLPGSLDNSQCRILAPGVSATTAATTLTLTLPIEFKASVFRDRLIYGAARDLAGNNSGWQVVGSVSVQ